MIIGDAPTADGAPMCVVPVRSLHCDVTKPEGAAGTGVDPQGADGQDEVAVLFHDTIPM